MKNDQDAQTQLVWWFFSEQLFHLVPARTDEGAGLPASGADLAAPAGDWRSPALIDSPCGLVTVPDDSCILVQVVAPLCLAS